MQINANECDIRDCSPIMTWVDKLEGGHYFWANYVGGHFFRYCCSGVTFLGYSFSKNKASEFCNMFCAFGAIVPL